MNNAITGHVRGKVQGVGYRYFTKSKAHELGLTGWVRNLGDGSVEFLAKGRKETLEQFMHYLEAGPLGSRVEGLDHQWFQEPREFEGFEIRG